MEGINATAGVLSQGTNLDKINKNGARRKRACVDLYILYNGLFEKVSLAITLKEDNIEGSTLI